MDQPLPVHPGERTSLDRPDWSVPEAEIAGRSIAMMIVESGNRGPGRTPSAGRRSGHGVLASRLGWVARVSVKLFRHPWGTKLKLSATKPFSPPRENAPKQAELTVEEWLNNEVWSCGHSLTFFTANFVGRV
jgi:hypothetical protein